MMDQCGFWFWFWRPFGEMLGAVFMLAMVLGLIYGCVALAERKAK